MSGNALVAFDDLDVESLAVIANESAEEVESSARRTVEHAERCGRALLAAKEKVPHGQWLGWLAKSFDYDQRHASRYMTIASNWSRVTNLETATSLREALRMIAEDPETPKRERKPSVEVIVPIEAEAKPILNDPRLPQPKPESTGETATNAVVREETRKAPSHRPPEKFSEVSPSYEDEEEIDEPDEPEAVPMRLESGFDEVEATERIRSFVLKEMAKWPVERHAEAIQTFHMYLGEFEQ
jgi:hypothetical protein